MTELLDLIFRWVHVIAGIMWVGNSMLFNFLDRNLRKRPEGDSYGDIWLLHSGGFYLMEKNKGERSPGEGADECQRIRKSTAEEAPAEQAPAEQPPEQGRAHTSVR